MKNLSKLHPFIFCINFQVLRRVVSRRGYISASSELNAAVCAVAAVYVIPGSIGRTENGNVAASVAVIIAD